MYDESVKARIFDILISCEIATYTSLYAPVTGTACYKNGKWYWYSSTTEDMLAEYGRYDSEEFDEAIECIAWMPLPEPSKEESNEQHE